MERKSNLLLFPKAMPDILKQIDLLWEVLPLEMWNGIYTYWNL